MKKIILGLAAAAVVAMVAAPAMAATQWNFGASLRYETFWNQADFGKVKGKDLQGGGAGLSDDGKLSWGTQGNSRIKMFMKSDSLEGFIELGYNFDNNSVTTREYWGKYRFNDMAYIQIGQSHQLFNTPGFSNQTWVNDMGMHGIGVSFNPPTPKIILGYGGFAFALVQPYEKDSHKGKTIDNGATPPITHAAYSADIDTYLPQIQASYQYKADTWRVKLAGAFQTYKLKDPTRYDYVAPNFVGTKISNKNINSWLVALEGEIFFGPLYLKGTGSVGQNWSDAQWNTARGGLHNDYASSKTMDKFGYAFKGNKVKNTTSAMAAVIAGYRLTEALKFEAGAGYRYDDNNAWEKESHMWNVYLQAAYTVAPGFTITPEVGFIELGKDTFEKGSKKDAGYTWYAGAQWRMDF